MKIYKEKVLNETIELDGSIKVFSDALNSMIKSLESTRGNGVSVQILCSIINKKHNLNLNYEDYVLHHINLDHTDNRIENLMLIKTNESHISFHSEMLKSFISKVCSDNHLFLYDSNGGIVKRISKSKGKLYVLDREEVRQFLSDDKNVRKMLNDYIKLCVLKANRKDKMFDDSFILVEPLVV